MKDRKYMKTLTKISYAESAWCFGLYIGETAQ